MFKVVIGAPSRKAWIAIRRLHLRAIYRDLSFTDVRTVMLKLGMAEM